MVEVPFVCFGHYNLKIYKTQICHEISRQMNLAFHALVFCFNSKSWFSWVDEIASFGREKVWFLLRGCVSSFCKKPFFCQTMDLNFSLACQSRYELKIWIFFFLVSSQPAAAAVDSDTNISRVLAFPFSDSLLVLFLL